MAGTESASVSAYIASFPAGVAEVLENIRRAIAGAVPGAGEAISYRIAAVTLGGQRDNTESTGTVAERS